MKIFSPKAFLRYSFSLLNFFYLLILTVSSANAAGSNSYSYVKVNDPVNNVPLMNVFLPEGWTVNVKTDWNRCASASIALGIVNLVSPDGKAEIILTSPETYMWATIQVSLNLSCRRKLMICYRQD